LLSRLAERGEGWARRARRRWRRHARRHWLATAALPSPALSGALLAVRRDAWERTGPFDPGYRLYFEESDWLRRAGRAGLRLVHEPRAQVVHHYNRSAAGEPRAAAWFAESAERYARRWHGPVFRRLRELAAPARSRLVHPPELPAPPRIPGGPPHLELGGWVPREGRAWIELSPVPRGFPAAAEHLERGTAEWELPEEVWWSLEGRWRLALVAGDGGEVGAWSFAAPPSPVDAGPSGTAAVAAREGGGC
jgi:hypothetical protein